MPLSIRQRGSSVHRFLKSEKSATGEKSETAHKNGQSKDTINDGWYTCQVVYICLDDAVNPIGIGIFFKINGRTNPNRKSNSQL